MGQLERSRIEREQRKLNEAIAEYPEIRKKADEIWDDFEGWITAVAGKERIDEGTAIEILEAFSMKISETHHQLKEAMNMKTSSGTYRRRHETGMEIFRKY